MPPSTARTRCAADLYCRVCQIDVGVEVEAYRTVGVQEQLGSPVVEGDGPRWSSRRVVGRTSPWFARSHGEPLMLIGQSSSVYRKSFARRTCAVAADVPSLSAGAEDGALVPEQPVSSLLNGPG